MRRVRRLVAAHTSRVAKLGQAVVHRDTRDGATRRLRRWRITCRIGQPCTRVRGIHGVGGSFGCGLRLSRSRTMTGYG
jgi:hypothetical protein